MIIQTANIIAGFALAAPKLKELGAREHIANAEGRISGFRGSIGVIELALGAAALLERMGLVFFFAPSFGSSYPQAIAAIAMGLILASHLFDKFTAIHGLIGHLRDNAEWIGIAGMAVGLFSLF